jgi:hypothetical protein
MKQYWKPTLLLMVLSPLLAEITSGGTPLTLFFTPGILLGFLFGLYGLQVLVIREVATRRGYGLLGLWCLGLIYGLYNEGLRSETLFYPLDTPLEEFSTYGLVADVRVPFTLWICFFHALFSVVTPVLFVEFLFPEQAGRPWLPLKATWSLAILSVGTAVPYYLFVGDGSKHGGTSYLLHFAFIVVAAMALWFVAGRLPRTPHIVSNNDANGISLKAFFAGVALYLLLNIVPDVAANYRVPSLLFLLYLAALVAVGGWAIARRGETTRAKAVVFLLGCSTTQAALFVVFGVLTANILYALSGAVFTAVFVRALVRLKRKATPVLDCRDA